MAEQPAAGGPSFQQILERQGFDPTAGPDDFRMERAAPVIAWDDRPTDWYAIPTEIFVTNPLTGERETGALADNGAFISHDTEIKNYRMLVKLGGRVMVLGKSVLDNVRIGSGTIVNAATIEHAKVGTYSVIDEGAAIEGRPHEPKHPEIGNQVHVDKGASVTDGSVVESYSRIGDGARVVNSKLGYHVVIAPTDRTDRTPVRDTYRGHRTFIGRSIIGNRVIIESNAQIEGSTVNDGATIGLRADLEYVVVAEGTTVRHDARILKPRPSEKAVQIGDEVAVSETLAVLESDQIMVRKPLIRTEARMRKWWLANERAKLQASRDALRW